MYWLGGNRNEQRWLCQQVNLPTDVSGILAIEAVRGGSILSDIAVDDVRLQSGGQCNIISPVCTTWCYYRPRTKYEVRREVIFSVCLSVHTRGGGGVTPVFGSRSIPSLWSHVLSRGRGTPTLSQVLREGIYQDRGTPLTGTGLPSGWDWAIPPPGNGVPPWLGLAYPLGTGYAMGGTPLAVFRRRTFLLFNSVYWSLYLWSPLFIVDNLVRWDWILRKVWELNNFVII